MEGPEVNDGFNEEEYGHIPMSDNAMQQLLWRVELLV